MERHTTEAGYHGTGRAELFAVWAPQGTMANLVEETIVAHDLPRTAVLRPPAQFGVGGPFQTAGIPQIGAIAGPGYLLTVSPSDDMEKLDAALAARQIAWLADLATRLDPVPAAQLRQGDPTLGGPASTGNIVPSSAVPEDVACGPAPATTSDYMIRIGNLVVDYDGFKPSLGGVLLGAWDVLRGRPPPRDRVHAWCAACESSPRSPRDHTPSPGRAARTPRPPLGARPDTAS
jgi:hypothetical protein